MTSFAKLFINTREKKTKKKTVTDFIPVKGETRIVFEDTRAYMRRDWPKYNARIDNNPLYIIMISSSGPDVHIDK